MGKKTKKGGLIGQLWSSFFITLDAWSDVTEVQGAFVGVEGVGMTLDMSCLLDRVGYAMWHGDVIVWGGWI